MARRLGEFTATTGGRLNVMINNAGILRTGRFEDIAISAQLTEIDINAKGVVNGLHAAFPYLRATPNPVVVNLASASAIYGQAELATYSATKFFVRGITEALDIEWSTYDIRVIAIWPLYVQTAMTHNVKTGTTESLGINLTAQDVADAIVAAVEPSFLRRALHQVHFPVGTQTKASAIASRFSPAWLQRLPTRGSPVCDSSCIEREATAKYRRTFRNSFTLGATPSDRAPASDAGTLV